MKYKKFRFLRFFSLLLVIFSCIIPAFAISTESPEKAPRGEWRYEYDDPFIHKFDPLEAGGQPRDGYVFHQDGFISWSSGGASTSVSVNIGGGKLINVSLSIGVATQSAGVSGLGVFVPADSENAYKLYVTHCAEIKPYRSYYRETKDDPWELVVNSAIVEMVQPQFEARICGPAY